MTLTKEDWESDEAKTSARVLPLIFILAYTLAYALVLALAYLTFAYAVALVLAFASALVITLTIGLSNQESSIWYYIFRFPGALLHHWKVRQ